jgi:hypothetical protein
MKIIGVLSWYAESAAWLSTAVAGFGRVCDTIVAVDGAYALYPQGRAHSMPDQREAILAAAEAAGCGCVIHQPQTVWEDNEVGKRNHTLDLVRALGTEGEDWVIVFDGDYQMMQAYPDVVRRRLEETHLNVATYTMLDGKDLMADDQSASLAQQMDISTEWGVRTRGVFRLLPNLRYVGKHWHVVGDDAGGWPLTLFGNFNSEEPALQLENLLVVYHRREARAKVRNQAAEGYYKLRDELGVEAGQVAA